VLIIYKSVGAVQPCPLYYELNRFNLHVPLESDFNTPMEF